jgi:hypothetical protein
VVSVESPETRATKGCAIILASNKTWSVCLCMLLSIVLFSISSSGKNKTEAGRLRAFAIDLIVSRLALYPGSFSIL